MSWREHTVGDELGSRDGLTESEGLSDGESEGRKDGITEEVGFGEGQTEGRREGLLDRDGSEDNVGVEEGVRVGDEDGLSDPVGRADEVGFTVGATSGEINGDGTAELDGEPVERNVGTKLETGTGMKVGERGLSEGLGVASAPVGETVSPQREGDFEAFVDFPDFCDLSSLLLDDFSSLELDLANLLDFRRSE